MGQSKQSEKEGENEDNLYLRTMLLKESIPVMQRK
jgi:hypothetical protein